MTDRPGGAGTGPDDPSPTEPSHTDRLPFGEDLEELERLSEEAGLRALDVPEKLIEDELRRKSPVRRTVESVASILMVAVIFAFVIPWMTNADYADVWSEIKTLSAADVIALFAVWFISLFTIWSFLTNTLPGLTRAQAGVMNLAGSAVANVVPFGGAVGIGATYAQGLSWGFDTPAITLSVLVSGVWNVFSKLIFPIVAIALLVATGGAATGLSAAALVGVTVSCAAVGGFALVIRNERIATSLAGHAQSAVNAMRRAIRRPPTDGVVDAVLDFRHRSVALVKQRWIRLTLWMTAYKITSFLLQLLCVRSLGIGADELSWIEVLAAYTLGELLTASPITPSGAGLVEVGSAGLMISFGAPQSAAVASVLLFRAFTYLFEIPTGGLAWLIWATKRSWRVRPATDPAAGVR